MIKRYLRLNQCIVVYFLAQNNDKTAGIDNVDSPAVKYRSFSSSSNVSGIGTWTGSPSILHKQYD